jgi:hypothetical protein
VPAFSHSLDPKLTLMQRLPVEFARTDELHPPQRAGYSFALRSLKALERGLWGRLLKE